MLVSNPGLWSLKSKPLETKLASTEAQARSVGRLSLFIVVSLPTVLLLRFNQVHRVNYNQRSFVDKKYSFHISIYYPMSFLFSFHFSFPEFVLSA
ncbi:hypothetical protein F5B22DRAFT_623938 [Xylaria bambusicola]|uniref:uncharacterized protein n=1 Tax=Xylaria bambusicola TaxID=326684 RepID=UPI002008CF9D|nr:uncharacterized protein F5B22DRAFT_623938 [Xylaria bambusicola]KAI0506357.1 hypothetical protein F5B22DRAFT_623938 [Xylaria bambusicola]